MINRSDLTQIMDFAAEIGERVLISGGEIWRTSEVLGQIFHAYDIDDAQFFILPHTLMITVKPEGEETIVRHRSVGDLHPNMEQLSMLNRLVWDIRDNSIPPRELLNRLHAIPSRPVYPRPVVISGMALALASLTFFFGTGLTGTLLVIISIFIAMGCEMYLDEIIPMNRFLLCSLAAFLSGCILMGSYCLGVYAHPYLLMVVTSIGLIPGLPLINACRELLNGRAMSGAIQFLTAFVETFAVVCGFYLAAALFGGAL